MSFSALSATAAAAATSSSARLNTSPVGEYPSGDSSTSSLSSSRFWMACASTLRTSPVCMKSTPSTTPIGLAVMKFPLATRMSAPAIGEFGSPIDSSASISTRSRPLASLALARAKSSVTRTPLWKRLRRRRSFSLSSICGRTPCTSTSFTPSAASRFRSCARSTKRPSATTSPPNAMTKVLPRKAWI